MVSSVVTATQEMLHFSVLYALIPLFSTAIFIALRRLLFPSLPPKQSKIPANSSSINFMKDVDLKKVQKEIPPITPLTDLDWSTQEPRKIYKFSPKYFLTMGLTNTTINSITHIDKQYLERLIERQHIISTHPNALRCLPSAIPMVEELYTFLTNTYLPQRYPTIFTLTSTDLLNNLTNEQIPLLPPSDPIEALRILALNIDEDFLMLLPSLDGDGYSLQSYIWCYPVGFDAGDKLGLKLREAHKPVPGYKDKLESSMDRYFGKLEVGRVVYRVNWAIATSPALCVDTEYHLYSDDAPTTDTDFSLDTCYVRCELQTLFALPKTGGRILSVHLYLYPLAQIKEEGLGEELWQAIEGLKEGNVPAFWRYKRAPVWAERVKEYLRS